MKKTILNSDQNSKLKKLVFAAAIVSLAAYILAQIYPSKNDFSYSEPMITAAKIMDSAIVGIQEYCDRVGIPIDETMDPNRTGLIGPEISPIATTLGSPGAKRTTTNPNFAAVIVCLLEQAGVTKGDTIAIGSSASFPALMIASLAAAKAMQLHPIIIISLGSSSFGATDPDLNLLKIYEILLHEKIFDVKPGAISLGGDRDVGRDFEPGTREKLIGQIRASELPFIFQNDLRKNVTERMKIYLGDSEQRKISAFINIGGSYANIGTSELVLKLKPGFNKQMLIPPELERGVLFEMAARNIPTIHLLFIKGLAMNFGLSWDPIPLPTAGDPELLLAYSHHNFLFWIISLFYFLILTLLIVTGKIWMINSKDKISHILSM